MDQFKNKYLLSEITEALPAVFHGLTILPTTRRWLCVGWDLQLKTIYKKEIKSYLKCQDAWTSNPMTTTNSSSRFFALNLLYEIIQLLPSVFHSLTILPHHEKMAVCGGRPTNKKRLIKRSKIIPQVPRCLNNIDSSTFCVNWVMMRPSLVRVVNSSQTSAWIRLSNWSLSCDGVRISEYPETACSSLTATREMSSLSYGGLYVR